MQLKNVVLPLPNHVISRATLTKSLNLCEPPLEKSGADHPSLPNSVQSEGSDKQTDERVLGKVWEVLPELIEKPCSLQFAQFALACPRRERGELIH